MTAGRCDVVDLRSGGELAGAVRRAARIVAGGGVILCPTDTVYGFSCSAADERAIERIRAIKGRAAGAPMLVLLGSAAMAETTAASIPPPARRLMERFWPGPLTLVLKAGSGLPHQLTAGGGTVGMRLPADEFCRRLSERCGAPLVSTSANRSGSAPPQDVGALRREFESEVDLIVDAGERAGRPSTVADLSGGSLVIVREGAISGAELTLALAGSP